MPIKELADRRQMPRLGKIRLGIKVEKEDGRSYPRATDYFVVPDEIKRYVGDEPKSLNIMFPSDDKNEFAPQWLKCYSSTQGLTCRGDGMMCRRKVDTETGARAGHTTKKWTWEDGLVCDPPSCPDYSGDKPQCRPVMNLLFLLPDAPGIGVWQLDTSSFYSITNVNNAVDLIQRLCGRIAMIPLSLTLDPHEVEPPGMRKKTVHVLNIRSDIMLKDIRRLGRGEEQVQIATPEEDGVADDIHPGAAGTELPAPGGTPAPPGGHPVAGTSPGTPAATRAEPGAGTPAAEPAPVGTHPATPAGPSAGKPFLEVAEDDVPDWSALFRICFHYWQMQPDKVAQELGYRNTFALMNSGLDCWQAWLSIKEPRREDR